MDNEWPNLYREVLDQAELSTGVDWVRDRGVRVVWELVIVISTFFFRIQVSVGNSSKLRSLKSN